MKKPIRTFQNIYPQPLVNPTILNMNSINNYQNVYSKPPLLRPISSNHRPILSSVFSKNFIPISSTVPHNNQIRPMSVANRNLIQVNNINVPQINLMQRSFNARETNVAGNSTSRLFTPIINNNIINNQVVNQTNLRPIQNPNIYNYGSYIQKSNTNMITVNPINRIINPININPVMTYQNFNINPSENLNLSEYELLAEIGKGSFGKIYKVRWKVNQKFYAMKTEVLDDMEGINSRLGRGKAMRNFVQSTGCQGVVNIYGSYLIKRGSVFLYYELMDLCNTDFEKEIKLRSNYGSYYTEFELDNIIKQLISTLSFLEKQHITHRDIKPQNILIANGQYKLCDFGDIRIMQRDGLVIQRIRGSELYMSPILFFALRRGFKKVEHNTYKSDVFSLGMCLFYAACLSFDGPVEIREEMNMNVKAQILNKYLGARYSQKLIKILLLMLQTDESARPDFILLENAILTYGL